MKSSLSWLACLAVVWCDANSQMFMPANDVWNSKENLLNMEGKIQKVVDFVTSQHEKSGSPGWALAVVHQNKTLLTKGFGLSEYGNPSNPVTENTMFHIGSVSKTMIAVAFAKLVDDGVLEWKDTVKKHLPWFELQDKYAERYTTLHDLLTMNSVFSEGDAELAPIVGIINSEREFVERIKYFQTARSLREGYDYANSNFVILGQVLNAVTNKTWGDLLTEKIWRPLGMTQTYWNSRETPLSARSYGHYVCGGKVLGPLDISKRQNSALEEYGNAAGSVVSSVHDMAIFAKFLLNKGHPLFKSTKPISDITTGQEIQTMFTGSLGIIWGYHFNRRGRALGTGYGIDVIGEVMYSGLDYFDKNGDTAVHQTRTGFVPSHELGIVLFNNGQVKDKAANIQRLGHVRTYILGLLLDVPTEQLDKAFNESVEAADKEPVEPCDPHIYDHIPWKSTYELSTDEKNWLVGDYKTIESPEYNGILSIKLQGNDIKMHYGDINASLLALKNDTFVWNILFAGEYFELQVFKDQSGSPVIPFMNKMTFRK